MAHELFYTYCILYMRTCILIIRYLRLVSFHFYYPSLRYVLCLKTTLRPWDQMSSSTALLVRIWDLVNIYISSCFFFWETHFLVLDPIQLWIWMTGITHLIMDDLMLFNFPTYRTSKAILGIFPFRLGFIDLHEVAWSSSLTRCMSNWWFIVILSWSPSRVSLGPFS